MLYTTLFFGYAASTGTRGGVQVDISAHGIFKQKPPVESIKQKPPVETLMDLKDLPFHEWFALMHHDVNDETGKQTWDETWYKAEKDKHEKNPTFKITDENMKTVIETLFVFNRIDFILNLSNNKKALPTILSVLHAKNYKKSTEAFDYEQADIDGLLVGGDNIPRDDEKKAAEKKVGVCEESTLSNNGSPATTLLSALVTELQESTVDIAEESKQIVKEVTFGQTLTGIIHYDFGDNSKKNELSRKIYVYPANPGMFDKHPRRYHAYPYRCHDTGKPCLFQINSENYEIPVIHNKQTIDKKSLVEDSINGKTSHEIVGSLALKTNELTVSERTGFLGFTFIKGGVLKINNEAYFIPHRISGTSQTFNHTNIGCKNNAAKYNKLRNDIVKPLYMQFLKIN